MMVGFGFTNDFRQAKRIGSDIKRYLQVSERATSAAVKAETNALKKSLRADVEKAGLGRRLANTWRSETYPGSGKVSMNASGFLWSKAPKIIEGYDKGGVIRSRTGQYLVIPLPAVQKFFGVKDALGKTRRRRITPDLFEQKFGYKLRMIQRSGKNPILVADGMRVTKQGTMSRLRSRKATKTRGSYTDFKGRATVPLFVLVPHVTLKKKFDVSARVNKAASRLPDRLYNEKMRLLR